MDSGTHKKPLFLLFSIWFSSLSWKTFGRKYPCVTYICENSLKNKQIQGCWHTTTSTIVSLRQTLALRVPTDFPKTWHGRVQRSAGSMEAGATTTEGENDKRG